MNKKLRSMIEKDLYRYGVKKITIGQIIKMFIINDSIRFMILWRIGNWSYKNNRKVLEIFTKFILKIKLINNLSEIPVRTDIGEGFFIQHFSGITINVKAKLGKNINIHKGVTIGETTRGAKKGIPQIGNNVWIGINSSIVGGIKIGNNVLIAPNSYVNIDVPDYSIVFGNPAIIKRNKDSVEGYIGNTV